MTILGLTFAGTGTARRDEMTRFLSDTLLLNSVQVDGVEADLFRLPDGSHFAVSGTGGMGDSERSIGFLVDDLDATVIMLANANVEVGPESQNARERYAHFRAPDGQLYELVERLTADI